MCKHKEKCTEEWSNNFVNVDQIKDQCYSLVNLTPSDVFCILHIELQQQVKVALTSETSSARKRVEGIYDCTNIK